MNACYYYKLLLDYDFLMRELEHKYYYHGYNAERITICNQNDKNNWKRIVILPEGKASIEDEYGNIITDCHVNDLDGDYEMFNEIQCIEFGYLLFKDITYQDIVDILFQLCESIDNKMKGGIKPAIVGVPKTDGFSYQTTNGFEITLNTIPYFTRNNFTRKAFGAKCFPFEKSISKDEGIYVIVSALLEETILPDIEDKVIEDIRNLQKCISTQTEWISMKDENIYL